MLWFLAIVLGAYILDKAVTGFVSAARAASQERADRQAAEDSYRAQTLAELRAISSLMSGPEKPALPERIAEAGREITRRREVRGAIEKELGVR